MSTNIEKEITRLMALQANRQANNETTFLGMEPSVQAIAVQDQEFVEPVVPQVVAEPIEKKAESIIAPELQTNAQKEAAPKIFNWCKTRLNIVLVQSDKISDTELRNINGSSVYMNLPLDTVKVSEEIKHVGYLNKFLRPFAKALKSATLPNSINQLGTATEAMQLYKDLAINILENTSGLLPRQPEDRIKLLCNIVTEKNNIINDVILEFYLIYETEYGSEGLLDKLSKIEAAVSKDKLVSEAFNIHITNVFPLNLVPSKLQSWYDVNYSLENYVDTFSLPTKRDDRLIILGAIPNTKQPVPHIVLSKKL